MSKLVLLLNLIFLSTCCLALNCPTVNEIKNGTFNSWMPLYQYGEELASEKDVKEFRKHVSGFHIARWSNRYLEYAHCFYEGDAPIVQSMVFAHDAWRPEKSNYWTWIRPSSLAECATSPDVCGYIE